MQENYSVQNEDSFTLTIFPNSIVDILEFNYQDFCINNYGVSVLHRQEERK